MIFGYWTPVFGGWLRNIADENTPANFAHYLEIAKYAENAGFQLTLVPELNLNDIKGNSAPSSDAWSTAIALAASTNKLEILTAIRPIYHPVALTAKQLVTIEDIAQDRFSINVVSGWWEEEARQYGINFPSHDTKYEYSKEYVSVLKGLFSATPYSFEGKYITLKDTYLEPKPRKIPKIYAGGESESGREAISEFADIYLTHGGTVSELQAKYDDMLNRRKAKGKNKFEHFGMAAFVIVRDSYEEAQAEYNRITNPTNSAGFGSYQDFVTKSNLDTKLSLADYSVSNRGLRPDLVGTPQQVADKLKAYEAVGVDMVILQFSPMLSELQRFAEQVIPLMG